MFLIFYLDGTSYMVQDVPPNANSEFSPQSYSKLAESPCNMALFVIQSLMLSYQDVFAEVTPLPPIRLHTHSIPLLPNALPLNIRPYCYHTPKK